MKLYVNTKISDEEHKWIHQECLRRCELNTSPYFKKIPDDNEIVDLLDACAKGRKWENGNSYCFVCKSNEVWINQVENKLTLEDILWNNHAVLKLIF